MDEERVPGGVSETHNGAEHAGAAAWLPSSTVRRPVRQPVAEAASAAGAAARKWAYGGDDEVNWGGVGPESEGETRYPYHHQGVSQEDDTPPARGVDEETPPSGTAAVGTPLWHQARHTSGYRSQSYQHYEPHGDPYQEYAPEEPHAYDPEHYRPDVYEPHGYEPEPPSPRTAEAPESYPPPPPSGWSPPPEPELPKRVPGEPELPQGVEDIPADEERAGEWTAPELARIADELRRTDVPRNPGNGFDMDEVLEAVRQVAGVRDAWLRANATGVHTLRLDLADDADPAYVSKEVARMLGERMGLTPTPRPVSDAELSEEDTESSAAPRAGQPEAETRQRPSAPASVPAPRRAPEPEPVRQPVPAAAEPAAVSQPEAQPSTPEAPADLAESAGTPEPAARREPGTSEHVPQPRAHRRARHAEEPPTTAGPGPVTPTADKMAEALPRPLPPRNPGVRVVIDHVQVNMFGLEATVEVRLAAGERRVLGLASGPAVDGYVTRLAAVSAARAIDQLLHEVAPDGDGGRCFVEHTGVVPFGTTEVAVVVVQLVCEGWVEQLAGCAVVAGDPRQAVVRATLGAVNRRLEALLT